MTLKDYLEKKSISQAELARRLQVTEMAVHFWVAGRRIPARESMDRIVKLTRGWVKPNDFYADPPKPQRKTG